MMYRRLLPRLQRRRTTSALLDRFGLSDFDTLQRRISAALVQGSQLIATHVLSIGQNTFEFVAGVFIALYMAFFLIRDGDDGVRGALLWGVVMAFLSLLPAIGAGLVWLAVAVYFLITGAIWHIYGTTRSGA